MYTSGTTGLPKGARCIPTGRCFAQAASVVQIFRPRRLAAMLNHFPLYTTRDRGADVFLLTGGKLLLMGRFRPGRR